MLLLVVGRQRRDRIGARADRGATGPVPGPRSLLAGAGEEKEKKEDRENHACGGADAVIRAERMTLGERADNRYV